jgi:DNA-binding NarL/FixJ family response regulator
MGRPTKVSIYASDPLSAAGAKAQLQAHPAIEVVGPSYRDQDRVALIVVDSVDDAVFRVIGALRSSGVSRTVVVASCLDEGAMARATAAGAIGFLPQRQASSARLAELVLGAGPPAVDDDGAAANDDPSAGEGWNRGGGGQPGGAARLHITSREAEILRLLADGYDTSDVAELLSYSESTIKGTIGKLRNRFDARNRCHVVALAVRDGMI